MKFSVGQRGDTIVEVLVAITIVSVVLTASYIVANRNYASMQDAQERTQAGKLLERQIEEAKVYAADSSKDFFGITDPANRPASTDQFCFNLNGATVQKLAPAACVFEGDGNQGSASQPAYTILVQAARTPAPDTDGLLFTATVTWDNISGDGKDQTQLQYGVYP